MKKIILPAIFAIFCLGNMANAYECQTPNGEKKLNVYWGHGQADLAPGVVEV